MKISWTHACDVLLDLIREREFISEEELSVRAGQPISSLPQIPQEDIDRIIMPPAGLEYNKNVVYEIVSENKGGDQTYDSIFIKKQLFAPRCAAISFPRRYCRARRSGRRRRLHRKARIRAVICLRAASV